MSGDLLLGLGGNASPLALLPAPCVEEPVEGEVVESGDHVSAWARARRRARRLRPERRSRVGGGRAACAGTGGTGRRRPASRSPAAACGSTIPGMPTITGSSICRTKRRIASGLEAELRGDVVGVGGVFCASASASVAGVDQRVTLRIAGDPERARAVADARGSRAGARRRTSTRRAAAWRRRRPRTRRRFRPRPCARAARPGAPRSRTIRAARWMVTSWPSARSCVRDLDRQVRPVLRAST